eukprot:gnl/Dysnectes_brevis/583_a645_3036.p1 GENE.gnl/Dysnectes_brevis/583_a645_3036~~gnl/Dysnectes_brevis/583_a645_3036.p1  ORF type:complete len:306 (-),score=69.03 gnl/Dysnectes_brevis/583_a645_3036:35-952(-)
MQSHSIGTTDGTEAREQPRARYRGQNAGIVRGNTWASHTAPMEQEMSQGAGQLRPIRRSREPRLANSSVQQLLDTVDPNPRRSTTEIQTAQYLEEIPDIVEEHSIDCQTDPFMEVPAPAPFIPPPSGIEVATQILEGDLFDFDRECQPLLDVLVGATLQQALREVAEARELAAIRTAREAARDRRASEMAAARRLEAAERRRQFELQQRLAQELRRRAQEEQLARRMAASAFASSFSKNLSVDALDDLEARGHFACAEERVVHGSFVPWLMSEAQRKGAERGSVHEVLKSLIGQAAKMGQKLISV